MPDVNCELCGFSGASLVQARGITVSLCDECLAEIDALTGDRPLSRMYGYNRGATSPIDAEESNRNDGANRSDVQVSK